MTMGNSGHETNCDDQDNGEDGSMPRTTQAPCYGNPPKSLVIFAVLLVISVLFSALKDPLTETENIWTAFHSKPLKKDMEESDRIRPVEFGQDKFLGGLLPQGFDEKSCLSRYQSFWNRRKGSQTYRPSSHLISRLRDYEALHERCGPHTKSFNKSTEQLQSAGDFIDSADCKYVVWVGRDGLGNRMITLVSAFLYALLSQRVLLVDRRAHISDLFCEPFPETSWLIPPDFPSIINRFKSFHKNSSESYGYKLKNKEVFGNSNVSETVIPPYLLLYLVHNYGDYDKRFFCDEDQKFIQKVPWLVIKSNVYFAPSLFLMPSFQKDLSRLFPEKETVFHFLGRYLFHPTNPVWRSITMYYQANLAGADEKIGIQIRVFKTNPETFDKVLNQILACVIKEQNLLPPINEKKNKTINIPSEKSNKTISVLMASLSSRYYNATKEMYSKHPTITGEIIQVNQPSNEQHQQSETRFHDMKAWKDMYLLSLTDKLVTSSKSTFGYVAQSLGGLKPWILYRPEEYTAPNPACQPALSMEPCFQAPPMLDCGNRKRVDTGKIVGYVRHCEDMNWTEGLKLFDKDDEL